MATPTTGNDTLFGSADDDVLHGLDGNDQLYAFLGHDQLFGDAGNDYLNASANPNDGALMNGGPGNDTISPGAGVDTIDGGDGIDELSYFGIAALTRGVVVDLAAHSIANDGFGNVDTITNVENVTGSEFADTITGDAADNRFLGQGGNDSLDGGAGNDSIFSGDGTDTLRGGSGADMLSGQGYAGSKTMDGGDGNDALYGGNGDDALSGGAGNDSLYSGDGLDTLSGGDGNDTLSSFQTASNASMDGGAGNDELSAGNGNNTLRGGAGNDVLNAQSTTGQNLLDGGDGDDTAYGGAGNDTLVGGSGYDQLYGGGGNDTYRLDGRTAYVLDVGGTDTAIVSADWVKLPSAIEDVQYVNGAKALPYWIDALLPADANGMHFTALLGSSKTYKYAFATAAPTLDYDPDAVKDGNGFSAFNGTQKAFVRTVLSYISSVVGITFEETATINAASTLVFGNNTGSATVAGYAYYPNAGVIGSDVFLSKMEATNLSPLANNRAALVYIHEIGHAIGLKHPFDQDGAAVTKLPEAEDSTKFTVMSYTEPVSPTYQVAYSDFDLAALQYLYGPNAGARAGNDTYTLSTTKGNFIWDGAGTDAIDGSALTQNLVLSLNPGDWSYIGAKADLISAAGQVTVNFGTSIENATGGSGADSLTGNELANVLSSGDGNDTLLGGDGADSLSGGSGDDSLTGGAGNDTLAGGSGTDVAVFSGAFASYTIAGNRDAATITGADGTDVLTGIEQARFSDGLFVLDAPPSGTTIAGKVYAWKGHELLANVNVTTTAASTGSQASATSNASGAFDLGVVATGSHAIVATRAATDTGSAVNSADALAALRIAVGVNPNASLKLSPYQIIAADVNKDGKVNSADALGILRMAVNQASAPTKEWLFVREDLDLWDGSAATGSSSLTRLAASWSNTPVDQGAIANLVGVLKGDVNGSWALQGSVKVEAGDPAYFTNLAASLHVPTDIWGV